MAVIEESQKYMMNMLDDLEGDLLKMLSMTRSDLIPLYDDRDMQPASNIRLSGSSHEVRLYQKLDQLSKEMQRNDDVIADSMKKM